MKMRRTLAALLAASGAAVLSGAVFFSGYCLGIRDYDDCLKSRIQQVFSVPQMSFDFEDVRAKLPEEALECFDESCKTEYKDDLDEQGNLIEYWQSPEETRSLGTGDCEDMALDLQERLAEKGYEAYMVGGIGTPLSMTGHAWVELFYEGEYYILDPSERLIKKKVFRDSFYKPCIASSIVKKNVDDYKARNGVERKITWDYDDETYERDRRNFEEHLEREKQKKLEGGWLL
jgi:hypothetical protein